LHLKIPGDKAFDNLNGKEITNILLVAGALLYGVNYIIGWLLYFRRISMQKNSHQVFFAAIIFNLVLLLFFIPFFSAAWLFCLLSLVFMLLLPLGKKGGFYHVLISTGGLGSFIFLFSMLLF
jgi:hypothetical protein